MRLKILHRDCWAVVAPMDGEGNCAMEGQLMEYMADPKLKGYVVGFRALWGRIPRTGPRALGTVLYHCVDEEHEIYEFIKGPLRLLCFEAQGACIVCSHVLRKQSQKIRNQDKAPAIALRNAYLAAAARGEVSIIEDEEDEGI